MTPRWDGRYITAEDVGTTVADMDWIHMETDYVTGVSPAFGASGNPAPVTAYGVYRGMKAAAKVAYGSDSLSGKVVAIQGIGNVAYYLLKHLHAEGAYLVVTDIEEERVNKAVAEFGAKPVGAEAIFAAECDIFAPCALGGVLNDETIPLIKAKVIAGAANNQLKEGRHGDLLHQKGVLYVPDYVINAGGLINVADELQGYNRERALQKVEGIYDHVLRLFAIADRESIPFYQAADRMAEERIARVARSRKMFVKNEKSLLSR